MNAQEAFLRLRRGERDSEAWEVFYLYMRDHLLAYVSSLLHAFGIGGPEQAADVVHDVLLVFLERWPELAKKISTLEESEAYLRKSCRNLLVDRHRHHKTAQNFINFASVRFSQAFANDEEIYKRLFVDKIISLAPGSCADLLRIYVEQDVTPAELADSLGQSTSTFYSRWYRCIAKIKSLLRSGEK
jgi:RNA polymerase sigma factor (sigma-70 family)